jgi:hypothetical protein
MPDEATTGSPAKALVSTVFSREAANNPSEPDLVLLSSDGVLFFVHVAVLKAASQNDFQGRLANVYPVTMEGTRRAREKRRAEQIQYFNSFAETDVSHLPTSVHLPEPSQVLSIFLHCVYGLGTVLHIVPPSLGYLCGAVETLYNYGMAPLENYVNPTSSLFQSLIKHAEDSSHSTEANVSLAVQYSDSLVNHVGALQVYTLAASYGLHDLAAAASEHLVSLPLLQLTDEDAVRIGPVYLKHLFLLQHDRNEALKKLMLRPPSTLTLWFSKSSSYSSAKHTCSAEEMDSVARAWSYAVANVTLSSSIAPNSKLLDALMRPAGDDISCVACKRLWAERVYEVTSAFSQVKASRVPAHSHSSIIS